MSETSGAHDPDAIQSSLQEAASFERSDLNRRRGFVLVGMGASLSLLALAWIVQTLAFGDGAVFWVLVVGFGTMSLALPFAAFALKKRPAWRPVFAPAKEATWDDAVRMFLFAALGLAALLFALWYTGSLEKMMVVFAALMAATLSGTTITLARHHHHALLMVFGVASIVWPVLMILELLDPANAFLWLALGYGIPLALAGFQRVLLPRW